MLISLWWLAIGSKEREWNCIRGVQVVTFFWSLWRSSKHLVCMLNLSMLNLSILHSFIHSFTHLFTHSFIHSFIQSPKSEAKGGSIRHSYVDAHKPTDKNSLICVSAAALEKDGRAPTDFHSSSFYPWIQLDYHMNKAGCKQSHTVHDSSGCGTAVHLKSAFISFTSWAPALPVLWRNQVFAWVRVGFNVMETLDVQETEPRATYVVSKTLSKGHQTER